MRCAPAYVFGPWDTPLPAEHAALNPFGSLAKLMKRHAIILDAIAALAFAGVVACFWYYNAGQISYAELKGFGWDEKAEDFVTITLRVDDPQLLAQVQPWRDALRREACDESVRRFVRLLLGRQHCENALRQPMERLTLVYENGHRETMHDAPLAIRKLLWAAEHANGGP
jgi:hypothetical protein